MGGVSEFLKHFYAPANSAELAIFYAVWATLFVVVNVIWDIFTDETPKFHFVHVSEKVEVLFAATTFASSLLLVIGIFDDVILKLAGEAKVPIFLAGASGLLISLRQLCPYQIPARQLGVKMNGPLM
jgi:hypothetical protein